MTKITEYISRETFAAGENPEDIDALLCDYAAQVDRHLPDDVLFVAQLGEGSNRVCYAVLEAYGLDQAGREACWEAAL